MHFWISFLSSFLLAMVALLKKSFTKPALLMAFFFAFIIFYYGGICAFLILLSVFLLTILSDKFKNKKKHEVRRVIQIFVNVGIGAFCIFCYGISQQFLFYILYAVSMAEALSDTLASGIGSLSKKSPYHILTLQPSTPGLSGNVSFLGMAASFFGSSFIAMIFLLFHFHLVAFFLILLGGFGGALLDSYLGAILQVKYSCKVCHKITERKNHCGMPTQYHSGISFIDNNMVNFLSNFCSVLLACLLLAI